MLAQSESSLQVLKHNLIQAQNDLLTSKLNYENIIGKIMMPNKLHKSS